ncbi:MAG TPA: hypothetical protein VIV11_19140 [Kofleriaceae bacterium]
MSERSSLRDLLVLAAALTACGKSGPAKPEADPAAVTKLTDQFATNVPAPAGVRDCEPHDLDGGMTMTFRSVQLLAYSKVPDRPEDDEWTNPKDLDAPAVRALLDAKDTKAKRQAAAEFLAAPFYVVYRVDYANAPMALGIKELKISTLSTRIFRYEKTGLPTCLIVFHVQNDQKISDDAIAVSDKPVIDPAVARILREDLAKQFVAKAPRGKPPVPAGTKQ